MDLLVLDVSRKKKTNNIIQTGLGQEKKKERERERERE